MRAHRHWQGHLDEVYVKINGVTGIVRGNQCARIVAAWISDCEAGFHGERLERTCLMPPDLIAGRQAVSTAIPLTMPAGSMAPDSSQAYLSSGSGKAAATIQQDTPECRAHRK